MSLFEFKTQAVRDLAWVMRSPGLVSPPSMRDLGIFADRQTATTVVADIECRKMYEHNLEWLVGLERDPVALLEWLGTRRTHRLGYYFEDLVEFWLRQRIAISNLHCHIQVQSQQQTLGEFDYLFYREQKSIGLHWEVAVKYYLLHIDDHGQEQWIGPNANDNFQSKLERLMQHQLTLNQLADGRACVKKLGFDKIRAELFLKGYLFYPLAIKSENEKCAGMHISRCHPKGWWCRFPQLKLIHIIPESRWIVLNKMQWLSPAFLDSHNLQPLQKTEIMTREQVDGYCHNHFSSKRRSILFAEMVPGAEDCWQEVKRGFVVHSKWPFNTSL